MSAVRVGRVGKEGEKVSSGKVLWHCTESMAGTGSRNDLVFVHVTFNPTPLPLPRGRTNLDASPFWALTHHQNVSRFLRREKAIHASSHKTLKGNCQPCLSGNTCTSAGRGPLLAG